MDISVIIVNFRSEQFLSECLESLRKNLTLPFEVIIVNNDSGELGFINDFKIPNLSIINRNINDGFAKACNIGAKTARGKILFFLNPDTKILNSNISDLFSRLQDPSVGICAPRLLLPNNDIQPWAVGRDLTFFTLLANNFSVIRNNSIWRTNTKEIGWVSGAALAITKKIFDLHGRFDEKFFMYFEDVDLCCRVKKSGYKILMIPNVKVMHHTGKSSVNSKKMKLDYYQSQDYYFKKHFGVLILYLVKSLRALFTLRK